MNASLSLTRDHVRLSNVYVSRAYFGVLSRALSALPDLLDLEIQNGRLEPQDAHAIARHLSALESSMFALSKKYLMAGRIEGVLKEELILDAENSGFPVAQELIMMAADAASAAQDLLLMPDEEKLKSEMLREILTQARFPVSLQNMMAKRQYAERLSKPPLFLLKTTPVARQVETTDREGRRLGWQVDWSVYDTTMNVPVIYLLDVEDTGRYPMPNDASVWPVLCHHLVSQSINSLTLKTIAEGVDQDFKRLHPVRLRRIVVGPFYANGFTMQDGAVQTALDKAGEGSWVLALTTETVESTKTRSEGLFTRTELQVYDEGTSAQSVLAPSRVFQSIQDHARRNFEDAHKYVLDPDNRLVSRR